MPFYRCGGGGKKEQFFLIQKGKLVNGSTESIYSSNSQLKWTITEQSGYRYLSGMGITKNYYVLSNASIHMYKQLHLVCSGYFKFSQNNIGNDKNISSFLQQRTDRIDFGRACTFPSNASMDVELIMILDGITDSVVIMGGCLGREDYVNVEYAYLKMIDMWVE